MYTAKYVRFTPGDSIGKDGHIRVVADNKDGVITYLEQSTAGNSGGTNIWTAEYSTLEGVYTGMIIDWEIERNRAGE